MVTSGCPTSTKNSCVARKPCACRVDSEPLQPADRQVRRSCRPVRAGGDGVSSWAPIQDLDRSSALTDIAEHHDATLHQIALAWLLARSDTMLRSPAPARSTISRRMSPPPACALSLTRLLRSTSWADCRSTTPAGRSSGAAPPVVDPVVVGHEAVLHAPQDGLGATGHIDLAVDRADVGLHGVRAEVGQGRPPRDCSYPG